LGVRSRTELQCCPNGRRAKKVTQISHVGTGRSKIKKEDKGERRWNAGRGFKRGKIGVVAGCGLAPPG